MLTQRACGRNSVLSVKILRGGGCQRDGASWTMIGSWGPPSGDSNNLNEDELVPVRLE